MKNKDWNYYIKGDNFSVMKREGNNFIVISQIGKEVERSTFATFGYAYSKHMDNKGKIGKLK